MQVTLKRLNTYEYLNAVSWLLLVTNTSLTAFASMLFYDKKVLPQFCKSEKLDKFFF